MEQLKVSLDNLYQHETNSEAQITKELYECLASIDVTNKNDEEEFNEKVIPKIYTACKGDLLSKDLIYFSLIANKNKIYLKQLLKYEESNLELDVSNSESVIDYCFYKCNHWFMHVIQHHDKYEKNAFSYNIYKKILLLRLLYVTNTDKNINEIEHLLSVIDEECLDQFLKYYVKETKCIIDTIKFCKTLLQDENMSTNEIYNFRTFNTLLQTFFEYLDLKQTKNWLEISKKLTNNSENEMFNAFCITHNILKALKTCKGYLINETDSIIGIVDKVQEQITDIKNLKLQVEILENIYSLVFLKQTDFTDGPYDDSFFCTEKEIRLILFLLKSICDEIKLKNIYNKNSDEYKRFIELNKYISDSLWRLELVINVKCKLNGNKILNYMLATPYGLIRMCLKQNDFERARQVIQISDLVDSQIAHEIDYAEYLQYLKEFLKTNFKIRNIQKQSTENLNLTLRNEIDNFKRKPIVIVEEYEKFIEDNVESKKFLEHYKAENEIFMNWFDIALTQSTCKEDCKILLQLALDSNNLDKTVNSNYFTFCTKIFNIFNEISNKYNYSCAEILKLYSLDVLNYKRNEDFYNALDIICDSFNTQLNNKNSGILNSNHSTHKIFTKLEDLCGNFIIQNADNKETVLYLQRTFNYLKAFSKILYIEQNNAILVSKGKDTSFFELLSCNRSEIIGKLLFEKNLNPSDFEQFFMKIKLDLVYHIAGNCFPTINLHTQENITAEEMYEENDLYVPNKTIISYVQKRNWLLAFILSEMHAVKDVKIEISELRIQNFFNYMKLPKIQNLKVLFSDNEIITALQNEIGSQKLVDFFNIHILKPEDVHLTNSQTSCGSLETAEEILEGDLKTTNWKFLYDIINAIPENHVRKNKEFTVVKDMILNNIVIDGFEMDYFKYVQYISDDQLRLETLLNNFTTWPGSFCIDMVKSELSRFKVVDVKYRKILTNWLYKIEFYENLKPLVQQKQWFDIRTMCLKNPLDILDELLSTTQVDLLLKFLEIHPLQNEFLFKIDENYLSKIFNDNVPLSTIYTLLIKLPLNHTINLCYSLLKLIKKRDHMQFVVDYLLKNSDDDIGALKNIQISLKILKSFTQTEQDQLWCLINEPLNIIEVLLMNTRLDKLGQVLEILRPYIDNDCDDSGLSAIKIDDLLREYAEKSIDFPIMTQPASRLSKTPESKLMQSIDSFYMGSEQHYFVMPEIVPEKSEWVQNDEVVECMCCQQTIFSMFNRRHHCRRCGRIICHNCSTKRMLVETYGDILVRVCDDCYTQTYEDGGSSSRTDSTSIKSALYDYWLLTDDPVHNQIVRDEFSYEHAPSVSLCLAILKHHSKSMEYPKFLLDQCNNMLKLLQPSQDSAQEIDYLLVIKMLKSLAVAAKMLASECMLHWGTSVADRILSQAELLGLLAERGCLNLLPKTTQTCGSYIDASVLRKLRDVLLEREQWNLALQVSTKAGLDNTGIFATWGKCYLRAGSLQIAREKFQRCFDKTAHYESSSDYLHSIELSESFEKSRYHPKLMNLSTVSENKPIKNPPLLDEIIEILETNTRPIDPSLLEKVEDNKLLSSSLISLNQSLSIGHQQADSAVCILNRLKNLNAIATGNYYQAPETNASIKSTNDSRINKPHIEAIFYDECIYYLTRYGSHLSLLQFYIKHGEIETALNYIIDNRLPTDIFIEIYTSCLKDGIIHIFQEYMSKIDSTLDIWKDYLRCICRHLEKQNRLHSLYQLQQFMGDYVRAAMTCIRFYKENVKSFSQLLTRINFLHQAEEHLKQDLEQEQWVEVATVRKPSVNSQESFEEKGITNPSLVMKMDSRNIDRHINTLWRQIEITKFLAECEKSNLVKFDVLAEMLPRTEDGNNILSDMEIATPRKKTHSNAEKTFQIPTLFGSQYEKIQLAVFAIVSGLNIDEGFGIAFRIIEDYKLKAVKVYCLAGKLLAKTQKYMSVSQLVNCIRSSGVNDNTVTDMCDEMLSLVVRTMIKANVTGTELEGLIKLITDKAMKISAYIDGKQLKSAYFLAVKYKRMGDVRRILREAELLNQPNIKMLCQKILQTHSHAPSHSKD